MLQSRLLLCEVLNLIAEEDTAVDPEVDSMCYVDEIFCYLVDVSRELHGQKPFTDKYVELICDEDNVSAVCIDLMMLVRV